jgi:hypothetical protein
VGEDAEKDGDHDRQADDGLAGEVRFVLQVNQSEDDGSEAYDEPAP